MRWIRLIAMLMMLFFLAAAGCSAPDETEPPKKTPVKPTRPYR
jgi:hypothetical protein